MSCILERAENGWFYEEFPDPESSDNEENYYVDLNESKNEDNIIL